MATQPVETAEQTPPPETTNDNAIPGETAPRDYEAEARRMGWKPEEEFADGDKRPAKFKDAESFVRDAEEWSANQKKTINRLMDEVGYLKRQNRKLMDADQVRYAEALEQVRREMREAVRVGDEQEFDRLEKKADTLRKANGADVLQGENPEVEFARFRRENRWLDRGQLAAATREEADAVALFRTITESYVAQGLDKEMPPSQFFAKVREEIEAEIPSLFNPNRPATRDKPASDVAPVGNRSGVKRAKTGANLPAEAKATAERYMRMGVFNVKTKEEAWNEMAKTWKGEWA